MDTELNWASVEGGGRDGQSFFMQLKADKSSRLGMKWSGKQTTEAYSPRSIKASDNIRQRLPPKLDPLDDVSLQALFKYFARLYFDASRTEAFKRDWKSCSMNKYWSWQQLLSRTIQKRGSEIDMETRAASAEQWHDFQVAFKFIQLITFRSCLTAKRLPSPGSHFSSHECLLFCWHVDFFLGPGRQIPFRFTSTMTCHSNASFHLKTLHSGGTVSALERKNKRKCCFRKCRVSCEWIFVSRERFDMMGR